MEYSFEQFLNPIKEINELTLKNLEKISAIQVKAIQDNAEISVNAMKAVADVRDLESLNDYLQEQISVAQTVSDNAVKDVQKISKLAETYANKVKEVVEKSSAS